MSTTRKDPPQLRDHSADRRMLLLAVMAIVVGSAGAFGAWALLRLIALATNLFWFGRISAEPAKIADTALGIGIIAVPVAGVLLVGLMARYGSEKITIGRATWRERVGQDGVIEVVSGS